MRPFRLIVLASAAVFACAALAETTRRKPASDDDATPAPSHAKKSATPRARPKSDDDDAPAKPKATPGHRKADDDDEPKPKSTPSAKKRGDDADESTPAPRSRTPKTGIDEKSDDVKKKEAASTSAPAATPGGKGAPPASIESSELAKFQEQPEKVKQLIESALALSKLGLTYKYGSDDPANGGMDCSGSVSYLLRQQGFKDVPRDSSGQYVWARKHGQFFAVVSKKAGGFEFDDLRPGDLMFWSGTYSIDRDPPVTHSMIYLGEHKSRKQLVMWGSSDGRSYDGTSRYGVGVFDFKMPKAGGEGEGTTAVGNHPDFLGYAHIPGLREAAKGEERAESPKAEGAKAEEPALAKKGVPVARKRDEEPEATPKPKPRVKK